MQSQMQSTSNRLCHAGDILQQAHRRGCVVVVPLSAARLSQARANAAARQAAARARTARLGRRRRQRQRASETTSPEWRSTRRARKQARRRQNTRRRRRRREASRRAKEIAHVAAPLRAAARRDGLRLRAAERLQAYVGRHAGTTRHVCRWTRMGSGTSRAVGEVRGSHAMLAQKPDVHFSPSKLANPRLDRDLQSPHILRSLASCTAAQCALRLAAGRARATRTLRSHLLARPPRRR